jgi:hypothetical protein
LSIVSVLKAIVISATLALSPGTGFAECLQDHAVYTDRSGSLTLVFNSVGEAEVTDHVFEIVLYGSSEAMQGHVIESDEPALPEGMVLYNCPDGDVTGADIEACTVWQNVVYAVGDDGKIGYLPSGQRPAVLQLLLADFGRAFRFSSAWDGMSAEMIPSGIFMLHGCREAG